ncbi:hypothetical protein ACFYVL_33500 [Streptomyces sp. NPDC004111]|uniref:hypothetical protein n=1 Tax=Streptomyces sp. NPDC004111 TaxID=3364690 RepID=UPI0036B917D3
MRFYGVDIHGLFTGELPPRYCLALIEHLPLESAFKSRALCDGGTKDAGWDRNTFLLAEMLDALQMIHTSFVRSKVKNPRSVRQPDPYRRPGSTKESETKYNPFSSALDEELPEPSEDRELYGETGQRTFAIPTEILARSSSTEEKGAPFKVS